MAEIVCRRCGRTRERDMLDWSSEIHDGVVERLCGSCTRRHIRDIEGKLDDAWWEARSRTVLVVEDDADTRLLIRMSLESAGYSVDEAHTGEDAVRMLEEGPPPCLVLADVGLPGDVDGWAVRDRARALDGALPVIVVSAYWTAEDPEPRDGDDFLAKPFDMDVLVDLVDRRSVGQAGVGRA